MKKYIPYLILILSAWLHSYPLFSQTIQHQVLNGNEVTVISYQLYDYDRDGDQDIVALEYTLIEGKRDTQLVWHENDAMHLFTKRKFIKLGALPNHASYLAIQDYNKDGLTDFLIACNPQDQEPGMILLYDAQKAGFYQRKILAKSFYFDKINHQDLNKDGRLDLLVSGFWIDSTKNETPDSRKQQELFLFSNTKTGFTINTIDTEGKSVVDWSAGDLNRDGYTDLVYAHGNVLQLLINDKKGTLTKSHSFTIDLENSVPIFNQRLIFNLSILDLNNDTYPEISWLHHSSKGSFPQYADSKNAYQIKSVDIKSPPDLFLPPQTFFVDINNDKLLDIVSNLQSTLYFYTQQANQIFVLQKSLNLLQASAVLFVDIDRDNDLDVLNFSTSNAFWYENDQGQYHCHFISLQLGGDTAYQFIDIDQDQDQDIFLLGSKEQEQYLVLFKNDGQGQFNNYVFPEKFRPYKIESLDVNQDGYADPLICTTNGSLVWMRNTGKFEAWETTVIDSALNTPRSMLVLDVDQDHKKDILVGCYGDSKLVYFRNLGRGKFEKTYLDLAMPMPLKIQSADFNQDGYPDLAVLSRDSSTLIRIYLNESGGKLRKFKDFKGEFGKDLVITDLNGDQKPDFLYTANGHRNVFSHFNEPEQKQIFILFNDFPVFKKQILFKAEQRPYYLQPIDFKEQNSSLLAYFSTRIGDQKVSYSLGKIQADNLIPISTQQLEDERISFEAPLPLIVSNDASRNLTELLFCVHSPFRILYFSVEQKP